MHKRNIYVMFFSYMQRSSCIFFNFGSWNFTYLWHIERAGIKSKTISLYVWNVIGNLSNGKVAFQTSKNGNRKFIFSLCQSALTPQIRTAGVKTLYSDSLCETEAFHQVRHWTSACYLWRPGRQRSRCLSTLISPSCKAADILTTRAKIGSGTQAYTLQSAAVKAAQE